MRKVLILGIVGFLLLSSCNDDNLDIKDVGKDNIMGVNNEDITPRLAFTSEQELQDFLNNVNTDVMNLAEGNISRILKSINVQTRSSDNKEFVSLLDSSFSS